eukprot:4175929-Pyramimonas_sp.AAC.1
MRSSPQDPTSPPHPRRTGRPPSPRTPPQNMAPRAALEVATVVGPDGGRASGRRVSELRESWKSRRSTCRVSC